MLTPLYLPASLGSRFAVYHPAATACRGLVVYLHPLAEEMNKSRRMAARQARSLAEAGLAVIQIDLTGCGDSSGDFGDATWDLWQQDALLAARWIRQQHGNRTDLPFWWWGLRSGTLLASAVASQNSAELGPCNFLFWQPTASGKAVLQQFLRLRTAGKIARTTTSDAGRKPNDNLAHGMNELRDMLRRGISVDVAGYALSPGLASGLEVAVLQPPAELAAGRRAVWLECSPNGTPVLSPMSQNAQLAWKQAGYAVHAACAKGPAFWQTIEIEDAPELLAATTKLLTEDELHVSQRVAS